MGALIDFLVLSAFVTFIFFIVSGFVKAKLKK